jgi:hypothetical protein
MPKLVCGECEVELLPSVNGVDVIEYAWTGPYKVWYADEYKCPNCGYRVISGFADKPFEHYQPEFQERLSSVLLSNARYDFENQEQRAEFAKTLDRENSR